VTVPSCGIVALEPEVTFAPALGKSALIEIAAETPNTVMLALFVLLVEVLILVRELALTVPISGALPPPDELIFPNTEEVVFPAGTGFAEPFSETIAAKEVALTPVRFTDALVVDATR
jgi:hypothetical protein